MLRRREILLIAESAVAGEFRDQLGADAVVHHTDAYEALAQMGKHGWPAIVVTAPRVDLAGLCRACRRLQADAKLLAVCSPAGEPDVRPLTGRLLDDYFIYPPTSSDWQAIRRAAGMAEPSAPQRSDSAQLLPADVSRLITAARSPAALEACLAGMLSHRTGVPLSWMGQASGNGQTDVLLQIGGATPRVLVPQADHGTIDPSARALAVEIQQCLPALIESARRTESLHELAITDHLTGAHNRRYFYYVTDQILLRCRQRNLPVTLLLYDIDDFKRYNDSYGHAAGDEVLRQAVAAMKQVTREQDVVARIGGDEFAVLFWDDELRTPNSQPPETALVLTRRFCQVLRSLEFPSLGPEARGKLTISGGLAVFPADGCTCRGLLRKADLALRQAKQSGKDSIHLVGSGSQVP